MSSAVVLVHGAWNGSWSWERVVPLLEERGVDVVALDLPSVGAPGGDPADLFTDARAVTDTLDEIDGQKVLVGHSYGGMVITAAGAGRSDLSRLVYLCAFMPDVGDSLFSLTGNAPAPWIDILDDGRSIPNTEYARAHGYGDCDDATRDAAIARLRPQVTAPFTGVIETAAWHSIPSTYIVCSEDTSLPPAIQRDVFGPRADEVVEIPASHAPFFSQPERLAEIFAGVAA
jgi:pimeloyl-ACP methyl ester carboxylesterase